MEEKTEALNRERLVARLVGGAERFAFLLLLLWCLLPVAMSLYDLGMGVLGAFPSQEEFPIGKQLGSVVYNVALHTYFTAFDVLGTVTLLFTLLMTALCWGRIWDAASLKARPWFYALLALLLWAVVSMLLAKDPFFAFTGGNYMHDGLFSYFVYAAVFLAASMLGEEKYRRILMKVFSAVCCWLAALMLLQETGIPFLDYCFPSRHAVVFNNSNHFGYILCMGVLALTGLYLFDGTEGKAEKTLELIGFALLTYAVLVNNTFGADIGIVFGLLFAYVVYFRRRGKYRLTVFIPVILFLALVLLNAAGLTRGAIPVTKSVTQTGTDLMNILEDAETADQAGSGRFILWKQTVSHIKEKPLFGFGPEGFYGNDALNRQLTPHNEYLQIAGYLGIPALLLYLAALISLVIRQWKNLKRLAPLTLAASGITAAYLVSAFVGNPVFNTAPYYWIFLGFATAEGDAEPLLSLNAANAKEHLLAKSNKRRYGIIAIIAICLALLLIGVNEYLSRRSEKDAERADILAMHAAKITADYTDQEFGSTAEYWFNAENMYFIPTSEPMPAPYGMGTVKRGGGTAAFREQYEADYGYDETTDYREMILQVTIVTDEQGEKSVYVEWVPFVPIWI